ncbi:UDP-4-amino-4,6-dideoxy-N-acetyl-beta-L-altrosamine transaminase [Cohaesibacter sp. CAU 1516]|uniref:UDP-4-amino-4, 6-dideoxy-N-acetyl-beta-L-altrosamine transaminase n=1 Tax=Cohaesibacter sp. CAU 1516 TaxID=2576038 RepID=UPI0010FD7CF0|nr:UDP-4-amino-4,6-dideoxy-N-acetyl-beta-L-altrosamine transaminase [Cohaesibacter sp. CAU 1516]TLP42084.1 UDP-4-amino-4,6-dideoxy-N-acetyl-beta-L-altrosamine transaminase [Cohaesibacter sp. CAU 1516]
MIPYGRQDISQADIDAVVEVLRSDFLTQGPVVPLFEQSLAKKVGADFAVAVNSATSALHLAVSSLGLGKGDLLWTSPITFVASSNCALYCGADVDFVDIDPDSFNMCPVALKKKFEEAEAKGKLPKIIVPVHMCGQSPKADEIAKLARSYGVKIVEDASHAIGAKYQGKYVGDCRFSDITVFSFHPVKIITSAEGGLATTNDPELAQKMALLRSHGITRDPSLMTHESHGPWYYQQVDLGYNYRMTEMQAALGLSQLSRLDEFVARRNVLAKNYGSLLVDLPVKTPVIHREAYSAFHLYVIRLQLNKIRRSHKEVFERLRTNGVGANLHYIPIHTQPYYRTLGFSDGDFPLSEQYYNEAISIPLYPGLSKESQSWLVNMLRDAIV